MQPLATPLKASILPNVRERNDTFANTQNRKNGVPFYKVGNMKRKVVIEPLVAAARGSPNRDEDAEQNTGTDQFP